MKNLWKRISPPDRRDIALIALSFLLFLAARFEQSFLVSSLNAAAIVIIYLQVKRVPTFNVAIFWRTAPMYFFQLIHPLYAYYFSNSSLDTFLLLLSAVLSALLIALFPIPTPCKLTGKFKVGTTSFNLQVPNHEHLLPVQCWFPLKDTAAVTNKKRTLLWTSGHPKDQAAELSLLLTRLAAYSGFPQFLSRHLLLSRVNSIWQDSFENLAPLSGSSAKHPIAIYSHGMYGWRQVHSSCCEKLASQGFIVFACDHAPDGMVSRPIQALDQAVIFNYHLPKGYNLEQERTFYGGGLKRRVADLKYLIDFLHHPTASGTSKTHVVAEIASKLDWNELNLFGHSYGGGTVTTYCCENPGVKRVVNLDPWMFPVPDAILEKGVQASFSFMNLSAEKWPFGKFQVPFRRKVIKHTQPSATSKTYSSSGTKVELLDLVIRGSGHQSYCEMQLIASSKVLTGLKMLPTDHDPQKFVDRLDQIILTYFLTKEEHKKHLESEETETTSSSSHSVIKHRLVNLLQSARDFESGEAVGIHPEVESFLHQHVVHESVVFHDII